MPTATAEPTALPPTENGPSDRQALPNRLLSLDALRGCALLLMVSGGWGITNIVKRHPELLTEFDGKWYGRPWKVFWSNAAGQLDHVAWTGCALWDLIQPVFLFIVGVAMPFSYGRREARGDSWSAQFRHALARSLILIALGIFLRSTRGTMTHFTFEDALTQIGLAYTFVFLLMRWPFGAKCAAAIVILGGYWFWFYHFPLPPTEGNQVTRYLVGHGFHPEDWNQLTDAGLKPAGVAAHWNEHTNAAAAADRVWLNLFPRPGEPWEGKKFWVNADGYQTLNFIPSIVTMLFGVMAGQMLRGPRTPRNKFGMLMAAGLGCFVVSMALDTTIWPLNIDGLNYSICPIIKRIWTPSWVVFSAGWAFWSLGLFYWIVDLRGHRRLALPMAIVGLNSLLVYCVARLADDWLSTMLRIHLRTCDRLMQGSIEKLIHASPTVGNITLVRWLGQASVTNVFFGYTSIYTPIWHAFAVLFLVWSICWWLYRRKIFIRI